MNASQNSVVPTKSKIHVINYTSTPQQIAELARGIPPDHEIEEIEKNLDAERPLTRLMAKKSSNFSINDIKGSNLKHSDNYEFFNKPSQLSNNLSQIYNMYNLPNDDNNYPNDANIDSLFLMNNPSNMLLRSNSKILRSIPQRPYMAQVQFGKSLSGLSNISNGNEYGMEKAKDGQEAANNMYSHLQASYGVDKGYVRIDVNELNKYDIEHQNLDNIQELQPIMSRNSSYQQMFKNTSTPALFRGSSGVIDPKILKKS